MPLWRLRQLLKTSARSRMVCSMANEIEPGSVRDRCGHCGGWKSLGHAEGSVCRSLTTDEERMMWEALRRSAQHLYDPEQDVNR